MSKADEYRRHADLCRRQALTSDSAAEKQHWLTLAASWVKMLDDPGPSSGPSAPRQASEPGQGQPGR